MMAGLAVIAVTVGTVIVVAAFVTGLWFLIVPGLIFVAVGVQEIHRNRKTAAELELTDDGSHIRWRSLWDSGVVPSASVVGIARSSRPNVYVIETDDGNGLSFWLMSPNSAVQAFLVALHQARPEVSFDTIYRRGHIWWRGLPPP